MDWPSLVAVTVTVWPSNAPVMLTIGVMSDVMLLLPSSPTNAIVGAGGGGIVKLLAHEL
jgi:hypothetical protein